MKLYVLGNWLRGSFEGEFASVDEAWRYLSARFLLSYPSKAGRHVFMKVRELNNYGIEQLVTCKADVTSLEKIDREEVMTCCRHSLIIL